MATSLSACFNPTPSSTTRFNRMKPPSAAKWWTPLFSLSPDPDYINNNNNNNPAILPEPGSANPDPDTNNRSRFAPGCFTEEKAKQMRMKTTEMSNFHDVMYHSAIASRLASDVSGR